MIRLAVATSNQGKLREIEGMLCGLPLELAPLKEFPGLGEIEENGETFRENAFKKARALYRHSGLPTIADDSGLVVDALAGRPGVFSARYAGPGADDQKNIARLLEEMRGIPDGRRGCAFICNIAYVNNGLEMIFEGSVGGTVLREPIGERGFGYDPIFWLQERGMSVAELTIEQKARISHRGIALRRFADWLREAVAAGTF
jgi:XTP/dITP diphosphohydrolase